MPTVTHALIGGGIGLFLKTLTEKNEKKFTNEHLIVFTLNSFVGPDFLKLIYPFVKTLYSNDIFNFLNMIFHTVFGWFFASILLSLLYFVIFRYATVEGKKGNPPLNILQIYLLIVAGGITHFALDLIDYGVYLFPSFYTTETYGAVLITYEDLKTAQSMPTGPLSEVFPWFSGGELLIIGVVSMFILIWMLNNKEIKYVYLAAGAFVGLMVLIMLLFGGQVVYKENDLGYLLFFLFFILFPLYLIKFSMNDDLGKRLANLNIFKKFRSNHDLAKENDQKTTDADNAE